MTQQDTFMPPSAALATDPAYWDVWHNPTDQDFIVAIHHEHQQADAHTAAQNDKWYSTSKPHDRTLKQYYRLRAHEDTPIPRMYRGAVQRYICDHPTCRSMAGSKLCHNPDEHNVVIAGGQCPNAILRGRPNIKPNAVYSPRFAENHVKSGDRMVANGDNSAKLQPELEKLWKKVASEPSNVVFGPAGPQQAAGPSKP